MVHHRELSHRNHSARYAPSLEKLQPCCCVTLQLYQFCSLAHQKIIQMLVPTQQWGIRDQTRKAMDIFSSISTSLNVKQLSKTLGLAQKTTRLLRKTSEALWTAGTLLLSFLPFVGKKPFYLLVHADLFLLHMCFQKFVEDLIHMGDKTLEKQSRVHLCLGVGQKHRKPKPNFKAKLSQPWDKILFPVSSEQQHR